MLARTEAVATPPILEPTMESIVEQEPEVITPEVVTETTDTTEVAIVPANKTEQKARTGVLAGIGASILSAISGL